MNGELLEQIEREILAWPGVWKKRDENGPGGIGVTGYRLGRRQIGHVHDDGHANLRFSRETRDGLIRSAGADPHARLRPYRARNRARGRTLLRVRREGRCRAAHRRNLGEAAPRRRRLMGDELKMSIFTQKEIEYLGSGLLGRLATAGRDGTPHVAPVGMFSHNAALDTIDIGGRDLTNTKKFRDIRRSGRAALVVDDLASTDPWRPRGIEICGRTEAIEGPKPLIRIYPERIVAWGLVTGGFQRNSRSIEKSA